MNKRVAALIVIVAIEGIPAIPSVAQSPGAAETELLGIQKQWADARVKPDIAYLEHLYAKEFRVQDIFGAVDSREDDISMFREGRIKPEFVRDEEMKVSVYGD